MVIEMGTAMGGTSGGAAGVFLQVGVSRWGEQRVTQEGNLNKQLKRSVERTWRNDNDYSN